MLLDEQVVSFTEAAKRLPKINGRRIHVSTLWRWARKGIKGVKLECRRLGGRFVTSLEAIERFSKELAEIELPERVRVDPKMGRTRTEAQRRRAIEQAEKILKEAGI